MAPARAHPKRPGRMDQPPEQEMGAEPTKVTGRPEGEGTRATGIDSARVMQIMSEWYEMQIPEVEEWRRCMMRRLYEEGHQFIPKHATYQYMVLDAEEYYPRMRRLLDNMECYRRRVKWYAKQMKELVREVERMRWATGVAQGVVVR